MPCHQGHDLLLGKFTDGLSRHELAVTKHGHPIGKAKDLFEVVRHVEDSHPLPDQAFDQGEQVLTALSIERSRGLVEDQQLGLTVESLMPWRDTPRQATRRSGP